MQTLSFKDRIKMLKRACYLFLSKDLRGLSIIWKNPKGVDSHSFYVNGDDLTDPIIETFIEVCAKTENVEQLNKFSANWLLRIAEQYAELNGIDRDDIRVMAHPIRLGDPPSSIIKEHSVTYLSNSFIDPTNTHVKELYKILSCGLGKDPEKSLDAAMEFLQNHYPEKVEDLV